MGVLRAAQLRDLRQHGDYRGIVDAWLANPTTPVPEITNHPLEPSVKYGFGVNFEQPVTGRLGLFGRWGWNEGQHESYAYTEVDQRWQIGVVNPGYDRDRRPSLRLHLGILRIADQD